MEIESREYPVGFSIQRPETQSRLTNFPLGIGWTIRALLLIPHYVILYFFGLVAGLVYFIATFAILFSGRYPKGLYDLVLGYNRWSANTNAYMNSLLDKYPPFTPDEDAAYPLTFRVDYPEASSRLLNFPLLGLLIRGVLLIPHILILIFLGLASFVVVFIAQFAILFTGSFPAGMHGFVVGVTRWSMRITAYVFGLTDKYPPFSTS